MRRVILVLLVSAAALAPARPAAAQGTPQPAGAPPPAPPTQTPPAGGGELDTSRSLFETAPNQFHFGGRLSGISGDPARFQRYGDFRDGVLLTGFRLDRLLDSGGSRVLAAADNIGWRDQRYAAEYERAGRFVVSGFWDQIPQFYSVDTKTPYTMSESPLLLDDATQRAIQNGQTTLSAYVPQAPQFDLRERRDIGQFRTTVTPTPQLDLTAAFTTTRHVGELPWGASFGFSNDVEVALPYDSRTNDLNIGAEWTNSRTMFRVAYDGSWFDNLDDTLVWDSPLDLTDAVDNPGRGRMALWPSNAANTFSAGGYAKFARRTQVTGSIAYGFRSNDEPLQPFAINTALPQLALPRASAEADATVLSTNLNLVSRPAPDWTFGARVRHYGYDNQIPQTLIPQFVSYDSHVTESHTGGPRSFAHTRTTAGADTTWSGLGLVALTAGYMFNGNSHDFRTFGHTGEHALQLTADALGTQWMTFRAQYELADRTGSELNEALLVQVGEYPTMRHYDLANRTRNRFTGQVDVVPNDIWTFSLNGGGGKDDFDESEFGLQESTFVLFGVAADVRLPNRWGAGASYNHERYSGLQKSRQASNPGEDLDPLRDWTVDSDEDVDYFSIYLAPPRIGRRTEARLSYDYSYAVGSFLYTIPPGSPLTPPNQLPDVYNKLQQFHVDIRHQLTNGLAATFAYLYEPFRVYDFAFDPTVVDSIVQPSSLVMGYVYRPYTAHSAVFGLRYIW
jgi:MtrB/PioB family decaheme-associated outer membrane protein